MVQVMGHEAVEGDKWIRKLLKERWMVQAMEGAMDGTSDIDHEAVEGDMDQEAVEGAVDGASDERSDRLQAMDHEAVEGDMDQEAEGAMDGASDGRSDGWNKLWIRK